MSLKGLCVLLLAAAIPSPALAVDQPEAVDRSALRVCSDPGNMPFSNVKGEGFENKIAELFAAKLGVPVKYTWFPQATGFLRNTLRARRCDLVIGMVSGAEMVFSTNPYYHSTYVMVTRRADGITADRLDDPKLQSLKIGLIAGTPPASVAARNGLMAHARPYDLLVDTRIDSPSRRMIEDLAAGDIDVALLWGPLGGYFAAQHGDLLTVTPLVHEAKSSRMDYYIAMGVRPGEAHWKGDIDKLLAENKDQIQAILREYHVPQLDVQGKLVQ
ncbi:MAG TPA: substrate-binding domain-containing protein [Dongiaceae bacterium]|jgi:quinoprotein dehydrogenase-associated probable ABC transporter substrate-binding protein|nr:substrate-binding domain-containing protein [Dongiaceae bacterium]